MTVKEITKQTKIHARIIYKAIKNHDLIAVKDGYKWKVEQDDLDAALVDKTIAVLNRAGLQVTIREYKRLQWRELGVESFATKGGATEYLGLLKAQGIRV